MRSNPAAVGYRKGVVIPLSAWRTLGQIERGIEDACWTAIDDHCLGDGLVREGVKGVDAKEARKAQRPPLGAGECKARPRTLLGELEAAMETVLGGARPADVVRAVSRLGVGSVPVKLSDERAWKGLCSACDTFELEGRGFINLHRRDGSPQGEMRVASVDPCFVWAFRDTAEKLGCTRLESMLQVIPKHVRHGIEVSVHETR